jgi:GntR family transcriptional regulator, transcriptional repressor for pyruvate dehydrogenase complex
VVQFNREKASDLIIRSVKDAVASGELQPGARLPNERDFAAQYGVSQPTAREAIRGLEVLGLVTSRHGSGVFVSQNIQNLVANNLGLLLQLQQVQILDVFDVRIVLGRESIRLAAVNRTDEDLARIREGSKGLETASSAREYAQAILNFLGPMSSASGNPLLSTLEIFLLRVTVQFQLVAYEGHPPEWWESNRTDLREQRERLYDALCDGPSARVEERWWEYTSAVRQRFESDTNLNRIRLTDKDIMYAMAALNL